jgi:riboflavin kinase
MIQITGKVVKGFGRGAKELGFPTANISTTDKILIIHPKQYSSMKEDSSIKEDSSRHLSTGIYYGYAILNNIKYHTVISIGYNPFYGNKDITIESHLIDYYDKDFYGEELSIHIVDKIRDECNFKTKEELIQAIRNDIEYALKQLEKLDLN